MKAFGKTMIVISIILIIAGTILLSVSFLLGSQKIITAIDDGELSYRWSWSGLKVYDLENNKIIIDNLYDGYEPSDNRISGSIKKINLDIKAADITINYVKGDTSSIESKNFAKGYLEINQKNGTLEIVDKTPSGFIPNMGKFTIKLIINLCEKDIDNLEIDLGLGELKINDINVSNLEIENGMGSIYMKNMEIGDCYAHAGMGSIDLDNIYAKDIEIDCGMGTAKATKFSFKKCYINNGMGDINLKLNMDEEDLFIDGKCGLGEIKINGMNYRNNIRYGKNTSNELTFDCGMGSVNISFN